MPSQLSICQLALNQLPTKAIQSVNENSLAGAKCRQLYPQARAELLAWHDWEFSEARGVLAQVDNDRAGEWAGCFALPANMATPRAVLHNLAAVTGLALLAGQTAAPICTPWQGDPLAIPFAISAGLLYTNEPSPILSYSRNDVGEDVFPPYVARALSLDLAVLLVMPILKDSKRQGELIQAAEAQRQRAMADDKDRQPQPEPYYIPEAMRARSGWWD